MVEVLSIVGLVIISILVLFFSRIMSVLVRVLFYALVAFLVLVLFFGISFNSALDWALGLILWAF